MQAVRDSPASESPTARTKGRARSAPSSASSLPRGTYGPAPRCLSSPYAAMNVNTLTVSDRRTRRRPRLFFRISRSSVTTRSSRRRRRNSSRSSLIRPAALPSSTSIWRAQLRSDCGEHPSSRASCGTERPLDLSSRTAYARNSGEYGGVFGIDRHPHWRARWPTRQMSTNAGELQCASESRCRA